MSKVYTRFICRVWIPEQLSLVLCQVRQHILPLDTVL
jgi:hypothetical protein